jgi:hypothetical protein
LRVAEFSSGVLQTIESQKPISPTSETFTILEKIFAPLQAALLALARSAKVYAVISFIIYH